MFIVERLIGDALCKIISKETDLETAMCLADVNADDEEPDCDTTSEDFSWEPYEGMARVISDDNECDGIIYWIDGDGKTGTHLSENDKYYDTVVKHMNN